MLTVHHLNNSRSHRILWMLEELGIPYELEKYQRDKGLRAPPELRAIHPLGKSPVVTDGDLTLAESGAILEYLADTYDTDNILRPERGTPQFERYRYWMHYAEGSAMTPLLLKLIFSLIPKRGPALVRPLLRAISGQVDAGYVAPQIETHANYWNSELEGRAWFVGDQFTAADIQMSYVLEAGRSRAAAHLDLPNVDRVIAAFKERPAYARAIERGGEYRVG